MKSPCRKLNIAKVVMKGSAFDEGTLIGRHKPVEVRGETGGQNLGEQLPKVVNETNRSEILDINGLILLRKEGDEGIIEGGETMAVSQKEGVESRQRPLT